MAHREGLALGHSAHGTVSIPVSKSRMTDAEYFDCRVREIHMLPEVDTFEQYNVVGFHRELSAFGAGWKITQLEFKDGSYYNVGQPDQGAHN